MLCKCCKKDNSVSFSCAILLIKITANSGLQLGLHIATVTDAKGSQSVEVLLHEPNAVIIDFEKKARFRMCGVVQVSKGEIIMCCKQEAYNYYVTGINYSEEELGTSGGSAVLLQLILVCIKLELSMPMDVQKLIPSMFDRVPVDYYLDNDISTTATVLQEELLLLVLVCFPSTGLSFLYLHRPWSSIYCR
jgi:hypothetical protein